MRPTLGDPAEVEHGGLLAELADHAEVVRDQQVGKLALGPQPGDQLQDARLGADVERAGRLVKDQQPGLDAQRAGDRDPLALAAGELVRVPVGERRVEAGLGQQLRDAPGDAARGTIWWVRSASAIVAPIVIRGSRLLSGSWNTICASRRYALSAPPRSDPDVRGRRT